MLFAFSNIHCLIYRGPLSTAMAVEFGSAPIEELLFFIDRLERDIEAWRCLFG